jgi:hypothetical protein
MDPRRHPSLGISAIAVHQPAWELENAWFGDTMPRKFAHHTGIEARRISLDDELTMGLQAVRQLQRDTGCNLADCRGIAFVSPSFIPPSTARQHLPPADVERERPSHAADELSRALGLARCRTVGLNWFCCGYSRALALVCRRWAPRLALRKGWGDRRHPLGIAAHHIGQHRLTRTGRNRGNRPTQDILEPPNSPLHAQF